VRPWQRIIVATGSTSTGWRTEDALLALAVADRLRRRAQLPLLVMAHDEGLVAAPLRNDEGVEVITTKKAGEALVKLTRPDDLILATAHAVRDASPITTWQLTRSLADANVALVAGPHRLVLSKAVIRRDLQPTGNPTL
jgi:hypothetical protein